MMESFTFVDVEATGLSGVPVEIGWAILPAKFSAPEDSLLSDGFLVRPAERWLIDSTVDWDPEAQRVHGIELSTLMRDGLPVARCIDILSTQLGGRTLWCDSRSCDLAWLEVLFAEPSGVMGLPFKVCYWSGLFLKYWREDSPAIDAARRVLADLPVHHRARLDAVRLALAFAAAWQFEGRNR